MRIRSITSMAAACLVLAGCADGGSSANSLGTTQEATGTETATASETSTTLPPLEYETPPQYPEGIEIDSAANAETFVQFAIDTLNYGQRFNNTDVIDAIALPDCGFCNTTIEAFRQFQDQNLRRVGAELECTVTEVRYQAETGLFYLDSDCTSTDGQTFNQSGEQVASVPSSSFPLTWIVTMINGPWELVDAGTTPSE